MEENSRTIIHLEINGVHEYYGSPSSLYDKRTVEEIGITKSTLNNFFSRLPEDSPQIYENEKCIIRKGKLYVKPSTRGRKKHETDNTSNG